MATPEQIYLSPLADIPAGARIGISADRFGVCKVTIEARRGGFFVLKYNTKIEEAVFDACLQWDAARRATMIYPGSVESAYLEAK